MTFVTSGLRIACAMPKPTEVAMSEVRRKAGTTIGVGVRCRPYRHEASTSVTTIPGMLSAVYTVKVEATVADLGEGSDQMKSYVPASLRSLTIEGTNTKPEVMTAMAGAPVTR